MRSTPGSGLRQAAGSHERRGEATRPRRLHTWSGYSDELVDLDAEAVPVLKACTHHRVQVAGVGGRVLLVHRLEVDGNGSPGGRAIQTTAVGMFQRMPG